MSENWERYEKAMAELSERMVRFENGLEHLLEVSARNTINIENVTELTRKIGELILQHDDRIKRLEGE